MTSWSPVAFAGIFALLFGTFALGQNEATFQLKVEGKFAPGEEAKAILEAEIEDGWHLYAMSQPDGGPVPTSIAVAENPVFAEAGPAMEPEPDTKFDQNFGIDTHYFEESVEFTVPFKVSATASPGNYGLPVKVRFQICSDTLCLAPQTQTVTAQVQVDGVTVQSSKSNVQDSGPAGPDSESQISSSANGAEAEASSPAVLAGGETGKAERGALSPAGEGEVLAAAEAAGTGLPLSTLAYIWFAMVMGGLALLTPCVFPMIPITVSYFIKREAVTRKQAVSEAGLYSVGIVLTFTLIGFALTALFGAGGINRLAANPLVNILIAAIFIVFALNLFGVLEIRLPSRWVNAVDRKSSTAGGTAGIMLMALTFSLTSFTCTVPFVGTVMVAASQGDWLWSLLGISVFAAVFSAPFFLLAVFPSLLQSLPKSGNWMNSIKVTMGFLELAAALKFISNVDLVFQWELITRPVFITIWLAIGLITTLYLLGWFRFSHEAPTQSIGAVRVFSAIFFMAVSLWLLRGLFGLPLGELDAFLPPRDYGNPASLASFGNFDPGLEEQKWLTDYQEALILAQEQSRPIFIDFTGYTCTNCRWMESNIFPLPRVQELFRNYVLVRLYTDGGQPEHEENLRFEQERFGTIALPLYALMSPQDEAVATFPGLTRNKEEFIRFLERGLAGPASQLTDGGLTTEALKEARQ